MKLVVFLTFCFMAYEILKISLIETRWNSSIKRKRNIPIVIIEILYLIFTVGLFFTQYWIAGISLLVMSSIIAYKLSDDFMDRKKYNKRIRNYLLFDCITSLLILSIIIYKELILK
jgi:hypothetical protein